MSSSLLLSTAVLCAVLSLCGARLIVDSTLGLSEVVWQPERTQIYIGSPSVLRLANGDILTSADRFGSGFKGPRNVSVFRSSDNGNTWNMIAWAPNQYWSNLFEANGTVYLLGTDDNSSSNIKIAASRDNGATWNPSDSAIIANTSSNGGYETGPTPTLLAQGRYWRAMEHFPAPHRWPVDYQAAVVSAPVDADLLNPSSWTVSAPLPFNNDWIPKNWTTRPSAPGYLEGNMVEGPDGTIYNILRFNVLPAVLGNYAIALKYDLKSNALSFDRVFQLPGGHSKFDIRRDPKTGVYLTMSSLNTNLAYTDQRNILAFCASKDLFTWTVVDILLRDDTGFSDDDSVRYTGFHYVSWQFDGDDNADLIYAIRTSYRGGESYHNANRQTFKILPSWRDKVFAPNNITVQQPAELTPAFSQDVRHYNLLVESLPAHLELTVTSNFVNATVDGKAVVSGRATPLSIAKNNTVVTVRTAQGASYTLTVLRPSLPAPPAPLAVAGKNFEIKPFGEGVLAYSNRKYVFANVPIVLGSGFNFTMIPGGADDVSIEATANKGGSIVAITTEVAAYTAEGWRPIPSSGFFHYTDTGSTSLTAFERIVESGQRLSIRQGGWAGSFLLLPAGTSIATDA